MVKLSCQPGLERLSLSLTPFFFVFFKYSISSISCIFQSFFSFLSSELQTSKDNQCKCILSPLPLFLHCSPPVFTPKFSQIFFYTVFPSLLLSKSILFYFPTVDVLYCLVSDIFFYFSRSSTLLTFTPYCLILKFRLFNILQSCNMTRATLVFC